MVYFFAILLSPHLCLLLLLIKITYDDFKAYDIYTQNIFWTFWALAALKEVHFAFVNCLLIILYAFCTYRKLLGSGDLYLLIVIALFFTGPAFIKLNLYASCFALSYGLVRKAKVIPFCPFIYLALLLTLWF